MFLLENHELQSVLVHVRRAFAAKPFPGVRILLHRMEEYRVSLVQSSGGGTEEVSKVLLVEIFVCDKAESKRSTKIY